MNSLVIQYCVLNILPLSWEGLVRPLDLLEEVVALIINEDECREVNNVNLPYSLHAKLWVLYALNALDVA